MSTIQIQVFAVLKDYFKQEFVLRGDLTTIEELRAELVRLNPSSKKIVQACRFAVNDSFVSADYKLNEHDTVLVLPPSSGG